MLNVVLYIPARQYLSSYVNNIIEYNLCAVFNC